MSNATPTLSWRPRRPAAGLAHGSPADLLLTLAGPGTQGPGPGPAARFLVLAIKFGSFRRMWSS